MNLEELHRNLIERGIARKERRPGVYLTGNGGAEYAYAISVVECKLRLFSKRRYAVTLRQLRSMHDISVDSASLDAIVDGSAEFVDITLHEKVNAKYVLEKIAEWAAEVQIL